MMYTVVRARWRVWSRLSMDFMSTPDGSSPLPRAIPDPVSADYACNQEKSNRKLT
jgi:hypothetical protein